MARVKFTSKPREVEAMRITGVGPADQAIVDWILESSEVYWENSFMGVFLVERVFKMDSGDRTRVIVCGDDDTLYLPVGSWVVRSKRGSFTGVSDALMQKNYDRVMDE